MGRNNTAESVLRSFGLHKHTRKLIDSLDGANVSAIIYSITKTVKANEVDPFRHLVYLDSIKNCQNDKEYSFVNDISAMVGKTS